MSITVDYWLRLFVQEIREQNLDLVANPTVIHQLTTEVKDRLTSATTVPATKVFSDKIALVAGAKTLDLTNLTSGDTTVDLAGLKVQFALFVNLGASVMTFQAGASNGYNIFGTSGLIELKPVGGAVLYSGIDKLPNVVNGSTDEIDVAGTGTEEFECILVAG